MARELRVTIVGDSTALQAALARAGGATSGFAGSMERIGSRLSATGARLTKGVTLPIVGIGVLAGKSAVDFQNAMELLHTQAGLGQGAIAGLSKQVLALAGPTATAPDTLAAGLYHLTSQGLRGAQAMDTLRVAAEGAKMGQANLEDVTNALGAVISSKISGVRSYGQAMGELNATVGAGDMRMQDLADAMGTGLAAKAAIAGVSLRDVGAALATLGDNNIRGAKAGTQLASALRLMEGPSKAASKAMAENGIDAEKLGETLAHGGLVPAIEYLKSKLGDLDHAQMSMALTHMFGGKQSGAVQVLIDQLGRLKQKEQAVADGGASFASKWSAYTKTAAYHLDSMGAAMQASGVTIGNILLPVVSELANKISAVVQWFDHLSAGTKKFILIAAGIAAAVGPALSVIGSLVSVIGAIAGLSASVALIIGLVGAVVAVGGAIAAAVIWPKQFEKVLEKLGLSAQHAAEVIHVLQDAWNDIKAVGQAVVSVLEAIWAQFGDVLLAQATNVWNTIKSVIEGALEVIRGIVNVVTGLIHGNWSQVWEGIKQITQGVWNIIVALVKYAINTLKNDVMLGLRAVEAVAGAAWAAIRSAASGAWNAISGAVVAAVSWLVGKVTGFFHALPGRIKAALGDLGGLLVDAGKAIIDGLIHGLEGAAGGLLDKARSLAGSIKGAFKSVLGIFSPSRVMAKEVGQPISQGIAQGITQGTASATAAASASAAKTVQAARQAVDQARSGFVSAFSNMAQQALAAFDQKVQAWVPPAQTLLSKMQLQDQVASAAQGVTSAQDALSQAQQALAAAQSPAALQAAQLAKNVQDAQTALDDLKANGGSSSQISDAQANLTHAQDVLQAFQDHNPGVPTNANIAQLTANVQQAQAQLTAAIRAQKEQELQMEAAEEQKKHDKLMALQREHLAKRLYLLQESLLKHPAEWHKMGKRVEKVLKQYGVRMVPSGQEWASKFASGITQGIPAVEKAAHAMAEAVDKYMPHSPAKTGPLSYDAANSGRAWAERFHEGFAQSFPDINAMTAEQMLKLAAGGAANRGTTGNAPLIGEVHVSNDVDIEVMARRLERRLAFGMR